MVMFVRSSVDEVVSGETPRKEYGWFIRLTYQLADLLGWKSMDSLLGWLALLSLYYYHIICDLWGANGHGDTVTVSQTGGETAWLWTIHNIR